ncbi:unnamed protein product [Schistocephalus solidus]|uniref:BPTI/Kunitz inhibitor domain-containing protein n=1 Tax=Schistocephalus solidus TaxID=70667 RepID=A0A183SXG5_SCHSO|nr:unnamed protein product [Schistocephalus solidus]
MTTNEICTLPAEKGMCAAYMPRFYFDATTGTCKSFIYGGCGGNKNNFKSQLECVQSCVPHN